jgi:hypothetical protein
VEVKEIGTGIRSTMPGRSSSHQLIFRGARARPPRPVRPAPEPIDVEERAALLDDLADLAEFRSALEQRGFLGVVISCPDCEEEHFFGWSLLRENLEHILQHGEPRVHEPAFEPAVDHYVTWDYAKGFVDGLLEGENEQGPLRDGWTSPAEAARRLRRALATRGLSEDEVAAVLSEGGLPAGDPGDR